MFHHQISSWEAQSAPRALQNWQNAFFLLNVNLRRHPLIKYHYWPTPPPTKLTISPWRVLLGRGIFYPFRSVRIGVGNAIAPSGAEGLQYP